MRLSVVPLILGALAALEPSGRAPARAGPAEQIEALVSSGYHPNLRWPDFSDVRADLERLYVGREWRPLWFAGDTLTSAARMMVRVLAEAADRGLDPADYDAGWLTAETNRPIPSGDTTLAVRIEAGLSVAAARFALALRRGRVSPITVHATLHLPKEPFALDSTVVQLAESSQPNTLLKALEPQQPHYYLLESALVRYRRLARDSALVVLPPMPRRLRPGDIYPGLPTLRRLLRLLGDDPDSLAPLALDSTYSGSVVEAVRHFQLRQGFTADGIIGDSTRSRMLHPFDRPIRQMELTLERFRWMPRRVSMPPIIVNIPGFRLAAFSSMQSDESSMLRMNVVVGQAFKTETPVFAADMKYLIFAPYWDVPTSIALKELKPDALKDATYLDRNHYELVRGGAVVLPWPENVRLIGQGVRIRQTPGPYNALGGVKFVFPNDYAVYLHDTPSRSLFERSRRDASHGCIRVADAFALARFVLRDQPAWTDDRIREAMKSDTSLRVNLNHPIPVFIFYATAIARENGDVYFYSDLYRHDRTLDRLLRRGYPYSR